MNARSVATLPLFFLSVVPSGRVCQTFANEEEEGGKEVILRKRCLLSSLVVLSSSFLHPPPLDLMGTAREEERRKEEEKGPVGLRKRGPSTLPPCDIEPLSPLAIPLPPSFSSTSLVPWALPDTPFLPPSPPFSFFRCLRERKGRGRRFLGSQKHFHYYTRWIGRRSRWGVLAGFVQSCGDNSNHRRRRPLPPFVSCFFSRHRGVSSSSARCSLSPLAWVR